MAVTLTWEPLVDFEQGQGGCTGHSVEGRWMVGGAGGSETTWGLSQESGRDSLVAWTSVPMGRGERVAGF